MRKTALLLLGLFVLAAPRPGTAEPAPVCASFTWDVSGELVLLSGSATPVAAADGPAPVTIQPGTFYSARLHPQTDVTLAARPAKPMLADDAHAGMLTFRVPADGRYRVSITTGHWIDVVDGDRIVPSLDFQGRRGCPLVHKIVEFQLPAGRDLVLQFAGGAADRSGVLITPAPGSP